MNGIEGSLLVYHPSYLGFACHGSGRRGRPMAETRKHPSVCGSAVLRVPGRTLVQVSDIISLR